MIDLTQLSKKLSYALRHNPVEFGITLDSEGWTSLSGLLDNLRGQHKYRDLSLVDIQMIVQTFEKKRFELDEPGDRIRAYYGHSVPQKINRQSKTPPPVLYHGTSPDSLEKICQEGLKPMSRQQVHLSSSLNTAVITGYRKHPDPVVLRIDAQRASIDGIKFYPGNQDVWLVDAIPPNYTYW